MNDVVMTPLALLQRIESKVRSGATGLPEQDDVVETWSGIGFRLGDWHFVSPMSEVTELFRVPSHTRLPNVKPWVLGVSNVRGRLIPLIDLTSFFSMSYQSIPHSRRVLVIEPDDQPDGLVVDGVEGMQYFPIDSFVDSMLHVPAQIRPFVTGHFLKDGRTWFRFSMDSLSAHDVFQDVAV